MKSVKWMLLGVTVLLFGISANLLSGLQGTPTYHNGIYELLGVICPILGLGAALYGLFRKDEPKKKGEDEK